MEDVKYISSFILIGILSLLSAHCRQLGQSLAGKIPSSVWNKRSLNWIPSELSIANDRLSTKFAVILHADIVDSTALVQQDEQLAHERTQDTFRRFSDSIEKYQGQVRELRGDVLLAEFERPSDAVTATLAFQTDQACYIEQLNDNIRPAVRVGIAMGEVVIADNTLTGAGVVLAQRLEQLSRSGGVCISAAIHESMPKRLPYDQADMGDRQVKGFDEPVRVYDVELGAGALVPPPQGAHLCKVSPKPFRLAATVSLVALIIVGRMLSC